MSGRLLIVADSPTLQTGFARVVQNLVWRWRYDFDAIDFWAIGFSGYPGEPGSDKRWCFKPPFTIYPAAYGTAWYTQENMQNLIDHVQAAARNKKPYTHIWIMQDSFLLRLHGFPDSLRYLTSLPGRTAKTYLYLPVDAPIDGDWARIVETVDYPVTYTEYGRSEVIKHTGQLRAQSAGGSATGQCEVRSGEVGGRRSEVGSRELDSGTTGQRDYRTTARDGAPSPADGRSEIRNPKGQTLTPTLSHPMGEGGVFPNVRVIPHGVDCFKYKLLGNAEQRQKLREEKSNGWIKGEDIVLINVNANQRRKDTGRSLEILARLHQLGHKQFKLIMWMSNGAAGDQQTTLESIGRQLGLRRGVEWDHMDEYFQGNLAGLPEEELNEFYNVADGYLTTTLGEGWGLGITEALATGLPVAVPIHTACAEIACNVVGLGMEDRVILMPTEGHYVAVPHDNSRLRKRVDVDRGVEAIVEALQAGAFDREKRKAPVAEFRKWLSWDRIADQWLELFKQPKRAPHYYIEYGGGLGDVFHGMFAGGSYNVLRDLKPEERATVALCCHNPGAKELFEHHPKRNQFTVLDLGYWHGPEEDQKAREKFALPRPGMNAYLPRGEGGSAKGGPPSPQPSPVGREREIKFYASEEEMRAIEHIAARGPFVVLAASAGESDRNLPEAILRDIFEAWSGRSEFGDGSSEMGVENLGWSGASRLEAPGSWLPTIVAVGRSYERFERKEIEFEFLDASGSATGLNGTNGTNGTNGSASGISLNEPLRSKVAPFFWNAIDKFSVPATAILVQRSVGLITCHSALNILGWHLQRPQLLLYPQSVYERHIKKKDQWAFGIDDGRTVHGLFGGWAEHGKRWLRSFMELLGCHSVDVALRAKDYPARGDGNTGPLRGAPARQVCP